MKNDYKELKKRAEELLQKSKQLETETAAKLGRVVMKYHEGGWQNFDLAEFKNAVEKILR